MVKAALHYPAIDLNRNIGVAFDGDADIPARPSSSRPFEEATGTLGARHFARLT
jgi:hypothetical protein